MVISIPLPVLAIDLGDATWIIIVVLSVLGWFVKAVKEHGANQPPARRVNPDKVRSEIESFLEEISGTPPKRQPVRPNPPNRPPVAKAPKKPAKPLPKAKPQAKMTKPGAALSEQHLADANLGAGLRSQVSAFMQPDRLATEVQQDLKNRVAEEVQADLGSSQMLSSAPSKIDYTPLHPLVTLLRDPRGVRQAIVLQEILQRPKSLRR